MRFNPHSPLLANELKRHDHTADCTDVSIHIRHCWRMNYCRAVIKAANHLCFNPHSPLLANELQWRAKRQRHRSGCFNPHSPLLANELWLIWATKRRKGRFNPHSPLLANELPLSAVSRANLTGFNPHSPLLANELSFSYSGGKISVEFQSTFAIAGE